MLHKLLKSKIHRATITAVEPDYIGSGECVLVADEASRPARRL